MDVKVILWVTLVLRDLCIQPNNEMIREAISLRNLPKSLAEVFNRALERIISEGKEGITRAILPWIVAAKQPLSLAQLEECCLIQVLQEYTMKDRYVNGIYLVDTWFQGLVEVDHETKTVHFVHSSVQKFFLTAMTDSALKGFYVNMEEADRHIGEVIVTYLNFNDFNKTLDRRRPALPPICPQAIYQQALGNEFGWRNYILRGRETRTADIDGTIAICTQPSQATLQETMVMEHPFLSYASTHWLLHSSKFNPKDCQVWHIWKEMLINGHELTTSPVSEGSHRAIDEAFIGWAVSTGHSSFFHLLATSSDIVGIGDMLYKATECDTVGDLRALIKDCMPFTEDKHGYLLLNAIEARQDGVVGFLLASGADPNYNYEKDDQTPLELGIHSERIEIIKLLLAFGANVNMKNPAGLTPIAIAYSLINPRVDIVELLFEAGAAIEAGESYKLFEKAVERKSADLAKLLVEQGVSVNARQYVGGITPLGLAATAGLFEIIHILLDAGAQVVSLEELLSWIPRNLRNGKEYEEISSRSWK
ncbi:hypothetical protein NW768_004172 [Fusarium equiseti]|uniref:Ankyrin repeat protein n=1 Tax=Fusarium equiseti TaxID=61235 RepID=A0ABQ8RKE5_FUSEQ|nr:hypothetical protein NW768_004172 [Fusarium equiseti]